MIKRAPFVVALLIVGLVNYLIELLNYSDLVDLPMVDEDYIRRRMTND